MRRTQLLFAFLSFTFLLLASTSVAQADPVVITFTDPAQTVVGGDKGSFSGTLTNTSDAPVTVAGSVLRFNTSGEFEGTLISFFSEDAWSNLLNPATGGPLILAPGETTAVIPIFRFDTSGFFGGPSPVLVTGEFTVASGDPFIVANQLGVATFTITVLPNSNPIPEPATMLLLGTGLVGIAAKVYRKRRQPDSRN